jgi:hypothetical protein
VPRVTKLNTTFRRTKKMQQLTLFDYSSTKTFQHFWLGDGVQQFLQVFLVVLVEAVRLVIIKVAVLCGQTSMWSKNFQNTEKTRNGYYFEFWGNHIKTKILLQNTSSNLVFDFLRQWHFTIVHQYQVHGRSCSCMWWTTGFLVVIIIPKIKIQEKNLQTYHLI